MTTRHATCSLFLFFSILGWTWAAPAIAQEDEIPGTDSSAIEDLFGAEPEPNESAEPSAVESLFESDSSVSESSDGQRVNVGSFGQIDIHVKDLDLTQVLQLLSLQSHRNIVASRNVRGSISADLYRVDFYEAMDAILHTNGFGYREEGNFIYVYTQEELEKLKDAERKPVTRVIRLNYLTAMDAEAFVRPLLSPSGTIGVSGESPVGIQPSIGEAGENSSAHAPTLVIRDYQENVEEISLIIKQLDVRPKQVLVEATILQASLDETNEFGIDLSVVADFALQSFANPLNVVDHLINGTVKSSSEALSSTVGNTGTAGSSLKVGIVTNTVAAFLRALEEITDVTVLARPKLMVLNRQRADLLVGERIGYVTTQSTESSTTQAVEFLEVGTQLTLRPFVSEDDMIRLELRPSISSGDTVMVGGGIVIPNTTNQEVVTNIMVRSGKTVVLGGLFTEDTSVTRRQVPWLGDTPLFGAAFKGQDDAVKLSEVIFLVRPTIMKDKSLYAMAERAEDSLERIRIGARMMLLPWSRTKLTSAHMRDAHKALKAGDRAKALWYTNLALTLEPTFVEAIRTKEQITGQRSYWLDRSLIDDAVNQMVDENLSASTSDEADKAGRDVVDQSPTDPNDPMDAEAAAGVVQATDVPEQDQTNVATVLDTHDDSDPRDETQNTAAPPVDADDEELID